MAWYLIVLEYLKTLVSWPIAAVVIVIILRQALVDLIRRFKRVTVGSASLDVQQLEAAAEKPAPQTPAPPLPDVGPLTPQAQNVLREVFQAERAAARLWEYRYLNLFLVLSTQYVLTWFATKAPVTTVDAYDAYWSQFIVDGTQRQTILQVLMSHHLVQMDGPTLRVSDKGKEYAAWRGPLPQLPGAGQGSPVDAPAAGA